METRQRARILAMAELLFDSDRDQDDEDDDEPEKAEDEEEDDGEGGFDRTCLREAVCFMEDKNCPLVNVNMSVCSKSAE